MEIKLEMSRDTATYCNELQPKNKSLKKTKKINKSFKKFLKLSRNTEENLNWRF